MNLFKPYRYYRREEIERLANGLLNRMQATPKYAPKWPFDANRVADFLDIGVVWDSILPDKEGLIAAKILPLQRQIEINKDILHGPEGLEASTIAHEIGHWELHINQDEADGFVEQLELDVGIERTIKPFLCRSISSLEGIEWQAQYFASCLLMPRYILEEKRKGRDLTKWPHLYAMRDDLGVTISNLTNRLQDQGLIYIPKGSSQIYPGNAAPNGQKKFI